MPPGHSISQNDMLSLLINVSEAYSDSTMVEESSSAIDCVESINGSIDCSNETLLPPLPPNACVCELAATQFTPEYATFNLILIVSILPTVAAFGVITNALALFVYTRSHMLTSNINLYLAALAISDIFVDICGISSIAIDSARRFDPLLNEIHLAIIPYTLPLCYIAQMCSVYFTVLAAFDCYLTVCWQHQQPTTLKVKNRRRRRGFCSMRNSSAKLYIVIIVLACVFYNGITFADLHVVECVDYSHPELGYPLKKEICPTDLRLDPVYSQVYKVYMYAVFMTFLPFSILLTLNCVIIWKIYRMSGEKKAAISRSDSLSSDLEKPPDGDSSAESTVMLVMVVALFLVCNSIALVVNIIETFGNYPMEDAEAANRLFFVIDIGNFLVVFNSSANFLVSVDLTKTISKPF